MNSFDQCRRMTVRDLAFLSQIACQISEITHAVERPEIRKKSSSPIPSASAMSEDEDTQRPPPMQKLSDVASNRYPCMHCNVVQTEMPFRKCFKIVVLENSFAGTKP